MDLADIKEKYKKHKVATITENSHWVVIIILLVVGYFLFSDFCIRKVPYGFWVYLRLLPIAICLLFLSIKFIWPTQPKKLLLTTYYVLLSSLLVMMLGISARTYQTELFSSAIAGVIIIIFGIFIAARAGYKVLLPIYLTPIALFVIYHLLFETNITPKEFADFSNPAALMIGAIILAEIQERMRYKEFSLSCKLKAEKERSDQLYNEVLKKTNSLTLANSELENQKLKIEQQHNNLIDKNKQLVDSEQKLKKSLQAKDMLFSVVAHDLRSPFTGLVGLTNLLSSNPEHFEPSKISEFSSHINASATKLLALIENLLNWSRSQTGNISLSPKNIKLYDIVTDTISICSLQAKEKNIRLINNIDENEQVFADFDTISVVIRNITTNAIKFTEQQGHVLFSSFRENNHINIQIADSGVGIEPKNLSKLFLLDHDKTTQGTSKESGTGLGLIVCKDFVEKNNGRIRIDSTLGEGTTVTISVPARG